MSMCTRTVSCLCLGIGLGLLTGCGAQYEDGGYATQSSPKSSPVASETEAASYQTPAELTPSAVGAAGESAQDNAEPSSDEPVVERQIIYTATLDLIVEDFDDVPANIEGLARQHEGFVASSSIEGSAGTPRSGRWTVRVKVSQFGDFLDQCRKLGEFRSLTTESEEVTAEYYDVKTRIANKQVEEKRLVTLLEEQTGKLEDVLKVEEQLSRVREEVERLEGRMRVLKDLTSYSTVTINVQEIRGYVPPQAPTFGSRIGRAWTGTLEALLATLQNIVIGIVALAPWLLVLLIPFAIFVKFLRMLFRSKRRGRTMVGEQKGTGS